MFFETYQEAGKWYVDIIAEAISKGQDFYDAAQRHLLLNDLWYMMVYGLKRIDMVKRPELEPQWLFERCNEVYKNPNGYLDLWAREHYKSTIITFGLTIQDILKDPEDTFGIFSVKTDLASDFLKMIKEEFQNNDELKRLFPHILYADPEKESPCWGIKSGIRVKRTSNRREETVEAHGLMGGSMPTGKHFDKLIYDDVVTESSVTNHEQLTKAFDAMRLSYSLGAHGGVRRMIGTRYHFNDAWGSIIKAESAIPRLHPATDNGKFDGQPVLLRKDILEQKRKDQGVYIFGCQMLQNPKADTVMGFEKDWLRKYDVMHKVPYEWNVYLIVDPSSGREAAKKKNDYTVMMVIGLAPDGNYYLISGIRMRLNLTGRTEQLIRLHKKWKPHKVGYEQYGMQADIEHIKDHMIDINYRFGIIELGGNIPKNDRIRKLVPLFEQGRFYIPYRLLYVNEDIKTVDMTQQFIEEEYEPFPVSSFDDMLDCMARIVDPKLGAVFPKQNEIEGRTGKIKIEPYSPLKYSRGSR